MLMGHTFQRTNFFERRPIMNECITSEGSAEMSREFTECASLAALGLKIQQIDLFGPIRQHVHLAQKTVKYTPLEKLYDAFIALLAGSQRLVEVNTRLRPDAGLQRAFGRNGCAEQSVIQQTLDACTPETVSQMEQALAEIMQRHSQSVCHDYAREWQLLDVDLTGLPCGKKAACATKGYFSHQRNRRGRQLGRVLASTYGEIVTDQLFAGNQQINAGLQPLMQAAAGILHLDESKRGRTLVRVDSGGGSVQDLNWLLSQGYQVMGKDCSGHRAHKLAQSVTTWFPDPHMPAREVGWVQTTASEYVRPVSRIAVRCRQRTGAWKEAVLITTLTPSQILPLVGQPLSQLADPAAVLLAYVTFYDRRGGGIETSFKGDKHGLGLGKRNKKRFEAQQMIVLLSSLVHNVIQWARTWLAPNPSSPLQHDGMLRMVRDVFHISGFLMLDPLGHVLQITLNQDAHLLVHLLHSFQELLAPLHVAINLGKT
jgi:hypothetical protein